MAKKQIILDDETKKRIAEKEKLTTEERFVLDAYIVSSESKMEKLKLAYLLSRKKASKAKPQSLEMQMYKWLGTNAVKFYLEDRQTELFGMIRKGEEEDRACSNVIRSKDETIEELNFLASSTADINKKADLLIKLADLQQWKKQADEAKEDKINFFAPIKCNTCPLYLNDSNDIKTDKA